jgi:hypothetical protein
VPVPDLAVRLATGTTYTVNPYPRTPKPTAFELHLLDRLGCGWSRETHGRMRAAGGAEAWLEQQLDPGSVREDPLVDELVTWFPDLLDSPARAFSRRTTRPSYYYGQDLANWTMLRRIHSRRQVHETMVDLWSNHFNVTARGGTAYVQRFDYDRTIRDHALGRFEDLLLACTLHPAMLLYLDNFRSRRDAPNENHGRELLELHTVGRTSGYTEQMVKDSAVLLSGWTVDFRGTFEAYYDKSLHTMGPVAVLGFTSANTLANGSELTKDYLRYLARHPATARTVARKMAVKLVSDAPSAELVDGLARVYLDSGTDITAMLRHLVAQPEFRSSAGQKVRTPAEDLVATCRVLRVQARRPDVQRSFGNQISNLHQGLPLYHWTRPDGAPERNADWASASRMMSSFRMHWNLAGGYYPSVDVSYRSPRSWLPQKRIRLDSYVDHLCRTFLGRGSTSRDLKAVCQATGYGPATVVTRKHPLARGMFVRVAACLLDSPSHMSR